MCRSNYYWVKMFNVFLQIYIECNLLMYQHNFDIQFDKADMSGSRLRRMFVKGIMYNIDHCINTYYLPNHKFRISHN